MDELIREYGTVIIAFILAGGFIAGGIYLFFSDSGTVSQILADFEKSICG